MQCLDVELNFFFIFITKKTKIAFRNGAQTKISNKVFKNGIGNKDMRQMVLAVDCFSFLSRETQYNIKQIELHSILVLIVHKPHNFEACQTADLIVLHNIFV